MRLQRRKLLTPVNAWFLNNKLKAGRKSWGKPNNRIFKSALSPEMQLTLLTAAFFIFAHSRAGESSKLTPGPSDCNAWKTLCDKYNLQIRSPLHPFVHLLFTHSAGPFSTDRSCFEKKKRSELTWREEEVQEKHFSVFTTASARQRPRRADEIW